MNENKVLIFEDDQEFLNFMDHLEKQFKEMEKNKKIGSRCSKC